ncbi:MAG: VWA domain-containing protein [Pyrinomonadaceae bacterium]
MAETDSKTAFAIGQNDGQNINEMKILTKVYTLIFTILIFGFSVYAQSLEREFAFKPGGTVEIKNLSGRVGIIAVPENEAGENKISLQTGAPESSLKIEANGGNLKIETVSENSSARIDLTLKIPERSRLKIETKEGEVNFSGNFQSAEVFTETGTIAADVPLENVRYDFVWTRSRPRFLSDVELEKVKEKAAGKFVINGKIIKETVEEETKETIEETPAEETSEKEKKPKKQNKNDNRIQLSLTTERGIILLNVNPNEVPSNLRERPLTEAAKAIIRSGDSLLTEAIRRASPKFFGDYAKTLPPLRREPTFSKGKPDEIIPVASTKKVLVQVTDLNNRAIGNLEKRDFEVSESGREREILSVEQTDAPFNLILLLDVSGSVDNYVDFIRKSARNFVNTVDRRDKVAIVIFNEDVKTLSTFTSYKQKLSDSLDSFDAGGGTAYYDALAYTLTETLRPLRGDRTAIVVLSDGDDNRSFLPFDSLLGSIQESGALIYPLYVPSGLIVATATSDPNKAADPLRTRYLSLTSKADAEGETLARVSGGVYYPITQINQLQKAYEDIVVQLRTAYTVVFRSDVAETKNTTTTLASPRLKVKVKRENSFVKLGSVVSVEDRKVSANQTNDKFFFRNISYKKNDDESFFLSKSAKSFEISGEIEKINYKQFVNDDLKIFRIENFDINKSPGAFILENDKEKIAVSRWISPKRTRSYPYERVYDTLAHAGKKVTIIPVLKDEGLSGERDFLQWDTISLLSLLDVRVILAYYDSAEKNTKKNDQITVQKFDNSYILTRLNEVFEFEGTLREWNERELKQLKTIFEKAKLSYKKISKETKTYLHDETALNDLIIYAETPEKFIEFSRSKSQKAQTRESETLQPKEALSSDTKAKVTITNALFGKYFFTVDETKIEPETIYLIEAKHSQRAKFPSRNDIKDGLVKMMLYTNLQNVKFANKSVNCKVQIRLTSKIIKGSIDSNTKEEIYNKFFTENFFDLKQKLFFTKLFTEARENNFTIILEHAETA